MALQHGSPPLRLAATDWRKIGKGLGIALAGSGLAYVGTDLVPVLPDIGLGWLAPLGAILVNVALKLLSDTRA